MRSSGPVERHAHLVFAAGVSRLYAADHMSHRHALDGTPVAALTDEERAAAAARLHALQAVFKWRAEPRRPDTAWPPPSPATAFGRILVPPQNLIRH